MNCTNPKCDHTHCTECEKAQTKPAETKPLLPPEAKVFVQVMTLDAMIHTEVCARLIAWSKRGAFPSAIVGVSPVDHARNESVRSFLKHNYDYMFFVDADTIPPYDAIKKLVKVCEDGADIATGITPILRRDEKGEANIIFNVFTKVEKNEQGISMESVDKDTGVVEVVRCGGSCLLIKRSAFIKIGDPWFKNVFNAEYTSYVGEDLSFCDRAKEEGLKIMCDTSIVCGHFKGVML
jgi:hypothetical protein